jgi:Bacterial SH3 domain
MKRLGSPGGRGSLGGLDKLLVIVLGLVVVVLVHYAAPTIGDRPTASAGSGAAQATATPTGGGAGPTATAAPTAAPSATPQLADPPYWRVAAGGDGANMRQSPSRTAPVAKELKDGSVVDNLDEQRTADGLSWRHVKDGDVDGWVAAELLVPQRD